MNQQNRWTYKNLKNNSNVMHTKANSMQNYLYFKYFKKISWKILGNIHLEKNCTILQIFTKK